MQEERKEDNIRASQASVLERGSGIEAGEQVGDATFQQIAASVEVNSEKEPNNE